MITVNVRQLSILICEATCKKSKMCHVFKFMYFSRKNNHIAVIVKRRVFDAALMSSLIYDCELLLGVDMEPVVKQCNWFLSSY